MAYSQKRSEERESCILFVGMQTDTVITETNEMPLIQLR